MCNGSSYKITADSTSIKDKNNFLMPLPTSFISIETVQGDLVRFNLTWWNADTNNLPINYAISFNDWWDSYYVLQNYATLPPQPQYHHLHSDLYVKMSIRKFSTELFLDLKYGNK